jgi:hypothetical protein
MKKILVIALISVTAVFSAFLVLSPNNANGSMKSPVIPGTTLPDSIQKIVQRACMDCHSNDGNGMARSHINFSKWSDYSAEKQADKAKDMCKQLTKGSMPTKGWRKNNADAIPTQAEVNAICNWSAALNK